MDDNTPLKTKEAMDALAQVVQREPLELMALLSNFATHEELSSTKDAIQLVRLYYIAASRDFESLVAKTQAKLEDPSSLPIDLRDFSLVATAELYEASEGQSVVLNCDYSTEMH